MGFQVGDRVWDVRFGEGKIVENKLTNFIKVEFDHYPYTQSYSEEGNWEEGENQSLFYAGTQLIPAPEPERCPFKEGELVLCRDHDGEKWQVHRFLRYIDYDVTYKFMTTTSRPYNVTNYRFCLPLAGNEHLLDTADSPE